MKRLFITGVLLLAIGFAFLAYRSFTGRHIYLHLLGTTTVIL